MQISVINHTTGKLSDEEVLEAIRAINRQIAQDYKPYWGTGGELRLEGHTGLQPDEQRLVDMRGDAVIYLWDDANVDNALGYHAENNSGIPFGFVFTELSKQLGENWSVTLSHEALELIGDPHVNLLVVGPHPAERDRDVFHWYEMSDAVQAETYEIDSVEVSNFVLPLYFTESEEEGARNDFLGRLHDGKSLPSFGVNPGGYLGFFDPELGRHDTFSLREDEIAEKRIEVKKLAGNTRRAIRYQRLAQPRAAAAEWQ
jgi:hypothetical protein